MNKLSVVIAAALLAGIGVCPAHAQRSAPPRPSGGLFGATRSDVGGKDKLNFTFEVGQGLDSAVPAELASELSRGLDNGGPSTVLQATSRYERSGRRLTISGNASTAFKYFRNLDKFDALGHSGGLGATVGSTKRNVHLEQTIAYSPSYLYQLFPVDTAAVLDASMPINADYQIVDTDSLSYRTNAVLSIGSVKTTQFTGSGAFNRTDFDQAVWDRLDMAYYEGALKLAHAVTSSGAVNVGYTYRSGEFGFDGPTQEHGLMIGLEYSPAISRSRRASIRLDVGPTKLHLPASAVSVAPSDPDVAASEPVDTDLVRLSSELSVSYPFRRNWRASARYRRSVEYLPVAGQPVLSDGGRAEVNGLITRRIDVTGSAGYVTAASALSAAEALVSYTGQVTVRYALKRSVALSSDYIYYFYDLRKQTSLAPHLPRTFEQSSIRVGVVFYIQAMGR